MTNILFYQIFLDIIIIINLCWMSSIKYSIWSHVKKEIDLNKFDYNEDMEP